MTALHTIRPATLDDAHDLAPRLRAADLAEIEAGTGRAVLDVLVESVTRSLWSEALLIDGRLEALGGLGTVSLLFGPGVPWLLGSDRLTESPRWFLGESRRQVRRMLEHYEILTNRVDARNSAAIRYLRHLGFALDPPTPWGAAGLPFHRFHTVAANSREEYRHV